MHYPYCQQSLSEAALRYPACQLNLAWLPGVMGIPPVIGAGLTGPAPLRRRGGAGAVPRSVGHFSGRFSKIRVTLKGALRMIAGRMSLAQGVPQPFPGAFGEPEAAAAAS